MARLRGRRNDHSGESLGVCNIVHRIKGGIPQNNREGISDRKMCLRKKNQRLPALRVNVASSGVRTGR